MREVQSRTIERRDLAEGAQGAAEFPTHLAVTAGDQDFHGKASASRNGTPSASFADSTGDACNGHRGGFDIAVGPLTTLWRQSRQSEKLPRPDKLALARAAVGAGSIELVIERQAVRLPKPGTRLDAGGIGRGYAADRVSKILADHGITSALIDSSGDVLASGPPPGAAGWTIAVAPLRPGGEAESLVLAHAAVATSGDAYQAVEIGGVRYSHIVDPRTGIGVPGPAAVTVVAADATAADALATAASVLGPTAGPALIASFPGTSARFAWQEAGASQTLVTPGWPGAGQRPDERPSVSPGPIASPLP